MTSVVRALRARQTDGLTGGIGPVSVLDARGEVHGKRVEEGEAEYNKVPLKALRGAGTPASAWQPQAIL